MTNDVLAGPNTGSSTSGFRRDDSGTNGLLIQIEDVDEGVINVVLVLIGRRLVNMIFFLTERSRDWVDI